MAENAGTIDSLLVSLGLETDAKSFEKGATAIKSVTDGMLQLAAIAGVGMGMKALTSGVANSALEMQRLSNNTGFTIRQIFNHGYTMAYTSSRAFLDRMKSAWRYDWLLSENRTVIIRDGATRPTTYEINVDNGMEGAPRWYQKELEVDVRMNHIIQPGDLIKIRSDFWTINYSGMYNTGLNDMANIQRRTGSFRVLSTTHQGDYWGDDWRTTLRCLWSTAQ